MRPHESDWESQAVPIVPVQSGSVYLRHMVDSKWLQGRLDLPHRRLIQVRKVGVE